MDPLNRLIRIVFLLLCIASLPLSAGEEEAEEFLTLIGVKDQVELYPQLISLYVQFDPNLSILQIDNAIGERVTEIVESNISNMEYFTFVVKSFSRLYRGEKVARYREWAKSALGRKITQMEMEASSPETAFTALMYSETLQENPPSTRREELIRRIIEITGSLDQAMMLVKSIGEGIYTGLQGAVTRPVFITQPARGIIPQGVLDESLLVTFLYGYREATAEELELYLVVLEDENTQWVLSTLQTINQEMIREVCAQIGQEAAPYFEKAAVEFLAEVESLSYTEYKVAGGGFAVGLPKEPERTAQTIPTEVGDIEVVLEVCEYQDLGLTFLAAFNLYPEAIITQQTPYELLDKSVAGMAGTDKVLVFKEKISIKGYPGYDVRFSVFNGMMFMRDTLFLVGNKLIQVMFNGPAYLTDHPVLQRFFNSLQLIE